MAARGLTVEELWAKRIKRWRLVCLLYDTGEIDAHLARGLLAGRLVADDPHTFVDDSHLLRARFEDLECLSSIE